MARRDVAASRSAHARLGFLLYYSPLGAGCGDYLAQDALSLHIACARSRVDTVRCACWSPFRHSGNAFRRFSGSIPVKGIRRNKNAPTERITELSAGIAL